MNISRRAALQAGYAAVIALLAFASVEAYRIQSTVSEKHLEIYRRHVKHDEAITEVRRTIWQTGSVVRDFFIDTRPETAQVLRTQLAQLKADGETALGELERLRPAGSVIAELRQSVAEFRKTVEPVPDTMLRASDAEQYQFVQREIVPRRSTLYTALRELSHADQDALQQSEIAFTAARRAAAQHLILILASCVILSIVVAGFSIKHAATLEGAAARQYEEVTQAKRELEALSARLVEMEEEWRKHFARELHDEIGQSLAALQIEIAGAASLPEAQPPAIRTRLACARKLVERTVETVRDVSLLLRPALLDDLGLVPALEWLTEDFARRSGVACTLQEDGVPGALPDSVKTCVYRIVQESLHNAEKHAGASRAKVTIGGAGGGLAVEIEDDGRGFHDPPNGRPGAPAGLGILGMRERAARLGGTLAVDTRPGGGTRVRLTVPVPRAAGEPAARHTAPRVMEA